MTVLSGPDLASLRARADLAVPAKMGRVRTSAQPHPIGRWDKASRLTVSLPGGALESVSQASVLAGANRLLVETRAGWELIAFQSAELIGEETYRVSQLLRGMSGTASGEIF